MNGRLKALLVGGPMYDPLHTRIAEFEEIQGLSVETVVAPTHPDLNEQSKPSSLQEALLTT